MYAMRSDNYNFLDFKSTTLYGLCFLLILDIIQTFSRWINEGFVTLDAITKNTAVCPPYFQNCLSYYFFDTVPISYGQNILYMALGGLAFLGLYFLYSKDFLKFFVCILPLIFYKIIYIYFLTYLTTGNFTVIGIFFGLILILSSYKIFYLRVLIVLFYLCAATIKLHDGYMSGSIFSSLKLGAPLIPEILLPYTGIVFFALCIVAPLGLMFSTKESWRTFFLWLLTLFHIYSISVVGFRYPLLLIPILWILFHYEKEDYILHKKYLTDWISILILLAMCVFQSLPFFIASDAKVTGEGYRYGYYMYDANHQCESRQTINFTSTSSQERVWKNNRALYACDPYEEWFKLQRLCAIAGVTTISWTYDHSVNGSPYRRIVDTKDACKLDYSPFKHNLWIQEDGPTIKKEVIKNSI